jgi:hypothetical protein
VPHLVNIGTRMQRLSSKGVSWVELVVADNPCVFGVGLAESSRARQICRFDENPARPTAGR